MVHWDLRLRFLAFMRKTAMMGLYQSFKISIENGNLCQKIRKHHLNIKWSIYLRPNFCQGRCFLATSWTWLVLVHLGFGGGSFASNRWRSNSAHDAHGLSVLDWIFKTKLETWEERWKCTICHRMRWYNRVIQLGLCNLLLYVAVFDVQQGFFPC